MIFGIGADLVHIPRMQLLIDKYDNKIALRILSEAEFVDFQKTPNQAGFLAKRFAAKEATAKALGTGFRGGLSLRHIAVVNNEKGKPELTFYKQGLALLEQHNIGQSMISLSDENEYVVAFVMLLKK